jgi:hypothetical protein
MNNQLQLFIDSLSDPDDIRMTESMCSVLQTAGSRGVTAKDFFIRSARLAGVEIEIDKLLVQVGLKPDQIVCAGKKTSRIIRAV